MSKTFICDFSQDTTEINIGETFPVFIHTKIIFLFLIIHVWVYRISHNQSVSGTLKKYVTLLMGEWVTGQYNQIAHGDGRGPQ